MASSRVDLCHLVNLPAPAVSFPVIWVGLGKSGTGRKVLELSLHQCPSSSLAEAEPLS